ncbi:MAG: hypothetical protein H7122_21120, partial [Chitinophagaceae bacterium]|nr:hypothetical protein [Chitinophagaceae bacterium]
MTTQKLGEVRGLDSTKHTTAPDKSADISSGKAVLEKNDQAVFQKTSPDQTRDKQSDQTENTKNIEENLLDKLSSETPEASTKINKQAGQIDKKDMYQKKADNSIENKNSINEPQRSGAIISDKKINPGKKDVNQAAQPQNDISSSDQNYLGEETPSKKAPINYKAQNSIQDFAVDNLIGDSIKKNYYSNMFPETGLENQQKSG